MKKIISLLLTTLLIQQIFSQKEKFDIITYTPPKDWKKEAREGVVNYTAVNPTTGAFCVIAMYASSASTGDVEKDFKNEWKELVVTPYKAEANPKTEKQKTADGWETVGGASGVKVDGADVYIILSVFSGFGKTVSIRTIINDQSYNAQIEALFETMELDKTKASAINKNPQPAANNTATVPTKGASGKFGLMTYTAPAGWSQQIFQDGVVFKPLDIPAGEHLAIQIMQPLNISGTLEQALAKSFEEATIMYNGTSMYQADGKYVKKEPKKSFNGWEYLRGKGGIRVQDGTEFGTEVGLEVFVIKINNRFERVAILESRKNCVNSRYYASDRRSYRNAIERLLFSLQFTDFTEAPLQSGSANGNGIVGIWQGVTKSTGTGYFRITTHSLILLNNGQVYYGPHFPIEGLDGLNSRIPPELNRRDWKTYTYSNGSGNLKMIFADIPFRTQGDKIIVNTNPTDWSFYKLKSVDGARFNGTYVMSEAYGKIPVITFTADGKFTDNGALKELYHENIDCLNPAVTPGSGQYAVKDYSIVFNYTDGRRVVLAFLGAGYDIKDKSPATLRMSSNEDPMTRQ